MRHVARHFVPDEPVDPQLESLHAEDLYLACACAQGIEAAIVLFDSRYSAALDAICRSFRDLPIETSDVRQMLRERLLLPSGGEPPRLSLYRGESELHAWVRVVATRLLINLVSRRRRESPEDIFDSMMTEGAGPEIALLRKRCSHDVALAFEEALATLTPRQKTLIGYQYVDELSAEEIARIYRVHRATVMRWQSSVRTQLRIAMGEALARRIKLPREELESFVRAALSGFDMTLSRYLGRRS